MNGDENGDIGILPRFVRDLLTTVENYGIGVHVSVLQCYRDWIIDLLKDVQEPGVKSLFKRNNQLLYDSVH